MRRLLLVIYLFLIVSSVFSQQVVSDTIPSDSVKRKPFVSRLFNEDPLKKHHHIVDFELFSFYPGYNYLYSLNSIVRVGGRITAMYYKSGNDIPLYMEEKGTAYGLQGIVDIAIWKTVRLEPSVGFTGIIAKASTTNTQYTGTRFHDNYLVLKLGVNTTLYKHLFLRFGIVTLYDHRANLWLKAFSSSIGYKF